MLQEPAPSQPWPASQPAGQSTMSQAACAPQVTPQEHEEKHWIRWQLWSPEQSIAQAPGPHSMGFASHASKPAQVIRQSSAWHITPPRHAFSPQVTWQLGPVHTMGPHDCDPAQSIVHACPLQTMPLPQLLASTQVTLQAGPGGHVTTPTHGLVSEQTITQRAPSQVPPAVAQALGSQTGPSGGGASGGRVSIPSPASGWGAASIRAG
jgi:hypothetical protein